MFKYELSYEDFLGNEKKETLRFNLSKNEIIKLVEKDPTFSVDFLAYVADQQDPITMFNVVNRIILASYGVLSDDGKVFRKDEQLAKDFEQSAMYDKFVEEMFGTSDTKKFSDFIIGIFPKEYAQQLAGKMNANGLVKA